MKRTWQAGVIGPIKLAGGFVICEPRWTGNIPRTSMSAEQFCGAVIYHIPGWRINRRTEIGPPHLKRSYLMANVRRHYGL
jgi:hypothetical protein